MSLPGLARLIAALSTIGAAAALGWLSPDGSALRWLTPLALVAGLAAGRTWPSGAMPLAWALAHIWPFAALLAAGTLDFAAVGVWLAGLAGLTLGVAPLDRWSLPTGGHVPVAAWAMVLALGWPIVLWRELDFTLLAYAQADTANGLAGSPARYTAAMLTLMTLSQLVSLFVVDALWARYGRGDGAAFRREVVWPMTAGTTIAIAVGLVQGLLDLRWINPGVWASLGRAGGTLFDGNAFGAVAALWGGLVASVLLISGRRLPGAAGVALLVASGIAVWVSGSRTALAGWGLVALGLAIAALRRGRVPRRAIGIGVAALVGLVATGALVGGRGTAFQRLWHTVPTPTAAGLSTFAREMWERNGYGIAAVRMIRDFPATGIGPGAFHSLAPDYAYRTIGMAIPPDNAQNWWRHEIAELGFLGSLPAVVTSILIAATAFVLLGRRSRRSPEAPLLGAALVALGFMGIVGPPTAHPIVLQTAAVLVFWASWLAARPVSERAAPLPTAITVLVVLVLPLTWAGLTWRAAVHDLRPPYRAVETGWVYSYGFSAAEPGSDGLTRWAARRAVAVLPASGSSMTLTLDAPRDAVSQGPIHVRVRDRHRVLLDVERTTADPFTCVVPVTRGERWVMVQIDAAGPAVPVDGVERALRVRLHVEP